MRIGNHVSFHGDVRVGDGTRIFDGAVLGRPPLSTGNVTREFSADPGPLDIGARSVIGANTVLYGGSSIGQGVLSQSVRAAGSTTAR